MRLAASLIAKWKTDEKLGNHLAGFINSKYWEVAKNRNRRRMLPRATSPNHHR